MTSFGSVLLKDINAKLDGILSDYYFETEVLNDSPSTLAVTVYGVPEDSTSLVEAKVNELDWEMLGKTGLGMAPIVFTVEETETYYPQYLGVSCCGTFFVDVPSHYGFVDALSVPTALCTCANSSKSWSIPYTMQEVLPTAADTELALAA